MCGANNPYAREKDDKSYHNYNDQDVHDRIHSMLLSRESAKQLHVSVAQTSSRSPAN
jgi:hypothetical protein